MKETSAHGSDLPPHGNTVCSVEEPTQRDAPLSAAGEGACGGTNVLGLEFFRTSGTSIGELVGQTQASRPSRPFYPRADALKAEALVRRSRLGSRLHMHSVYGLRPHRTARPCDLREHHR